MPGLYHVTCPSGSEKPGGQGCLEIRPVEGRTRNAALKEGVAKVYVTITGIVEYVQNCGGVFVAGKLGFRR
jgi:hypothetical protein